MWPRPRSKPCCSASQRFARASSRGDRRRSGDVVAGLPFLLTSPHPHLPPLFALPSLPCLLFLPFPFSFALSPLPFSLPFPLAFLPCLSPFPFSLPFPLAFLPAFTPSPFPFSLPFPFPLLPALPPYLSPWPSPFPFSLPESSRLASLLTCAQIPRSQRMVAILCVQRVI